MFRSVNAFFHFDGAVSLSCLCSHLQRFDRPGFVPATDCCTFVVRGSCSTFVVFGSWLDKVRPTWLNNGATQTEPSMPLEGAEQAGGAGTAADGAGTLVLPPAEVVLAPVQLPLPTKILGVCLYALAWMLLPSGLAANAVIALCCGLWVGSEICRMRRFAYQEWLCRDVMSRLSVSAFYVSRARSDNMKQLLQLAKDVVAATTQTATRCVLESLVVMSALWMASILPGLLWEIVIDVLISAILASLSGSEWLAQTANMTDDAELVKLVDQLVTLDKALASEKNSNPAGFMLAEERWRAKGGADVLSPWTYIFAAVAEHNLAKDDLLFGCASLVGALVLWWLLRRAVRRRLEHRLFMTKAGCVDLVIDLMLSEQPPSHGGDAHQDAAEAAPERRDEDADVAAQDGEGEEDEAAAGARAGENEDAGENDESFPALRAPRLGVDAGEDADAGGSSISQLCAATLARIATTTDAASEGPGLLSVEAVLRVFERMATPAVDPVTHENLSAALHEVLAGRQPGALLLAAVKAVSTPSAHLLAPDPAQPNPDSAADDLQAEEEGLAAGAPMRGPGSFGHMPPLPVVVVPGKLEEQRVLQLRALATLLPKQCSTRVRLAVLHTGLVGAMLQVAWKRYERSLVLKPIAGALNAASEGGRSHGNGGARSGAQAERSAGGAPLPAAARHGQRELVWEGVGAGQRAEEVRQRVEVVASNVLVRLATQLEWEASEKTPVLV